MSSAWQFYIATLIVYVFVYIIAAGGLNLQFGLTGVYNFAFIIFEAAGAYCTAVLSLGSPKAFGGSRAMSWVFISVPVAASWPRGGGRRTSVLASEPSPCDGSAPTT